MRERLQKILARAGHGSRRSAETIIAAGRVRINGQTVSEPGTQADPDVDRIEVDGKPIVLPKSHVYLAMHKPYGFVTTGSDPQGRRTVMELLPPGLPPHVFPVGRLDRNTEGLLLFTDDGELAHRLSHPRFEVEKEYLVLVSGAPDATAFQRLREGVELEGKQTSPAQADLAAAPYGYSPRIDHTWLRIVLHEGRKRQVRLMCAAVGHQVRKLVRTRVDGILLARLEKGTTRPLSDREVSELKKLLGL